jgi:hypothetical protein
MENGATVTTIAGETASNTENSFRTSPDRKMNDRWNEMVEIVRGSPVLADIQEQGYLVHFLMYAWDDAKEATVYPEFNPIYTSLDKDLLFRTINGL